MLVSSRGLVPPGGALIEVADSREAFRRFVEHLEIEGARAPGTGSVDPTARIGDGATVAAGATVGPGAIIGSGARVASRAVIGARASIGANAVVADDVRLGDDVRIGAGSVIGGPGFALTGIDSGLAGLPIPHVGGVVVGAGTWIGALVCIAAGTIDPTVLGQDVRIDNLVQVAHNCHIGDGVVIAAQSGLGGSVSIGAGARLGGQVGIADHGSVGAGATVLAKSGVFRHVPPGAVWGGYPARPRTEWLRSVAVARNTRRPARSAEPPLAEQR